MTTARELLEERASEEADGKNEIYYTPKQRRVLKAVAEHPDAKTSDVADMAGCHTSYVPYVIDRIPPEMAANPSRLVELFPAEEDGDAGGPEPADEKAKELLETYGVGDGGGDGMAKSASVGNAQVSVGTSGGDGQTITVTRHLPVTLTITVDPDAAEEEFEEILEAVEEDSDVEVQDTDVELNVMGD